MAWPPKTHQNTPSCIAVAATTPCEPRRPLAPCRAVSLRGQACFTGPDTVKGPGVNLRTWTRFTKVDDQDSAAPGQTKTAAGRKSKENGSVTFRSYEIIGSHFFGGSNLHTGLVMLFGQFQYPPYFTTGVTCRHSRDEKCLWNRWQDRFHL